MEDPMLAEAARIAAMARGAKAVARPASPVAASPVAAAPAAPAGIPPRPRSMAVFDQLIILKLALDLVQLFQEFPMVQQLIAKEPMAAQAGMTFEATFTGLVFSFLSMIALWYVASRLRNNVARWILTVMCGRVLLASLIGAPVFIAFSPLCFATSLIGAVMGCVAVYFLFTPESKAWYAAKAAKR